MKTLPVEAAVNRIPDGATLMIGGFMAVGTPERLVDDKRVVVAMQHSARGAPKIVRELGLPPTSIRPVDVLVTELAALAFPDGRATLMETAAGVDAATVLAATEAELAISPTLRVMPLSA